MKGRGLMAAEPTRGGDRKAVGRGYVGRRGPGWASLTGMGGALRGGARTEGRNSRMPPQLEKNHVVPTAWQDEALARAFFGIAFLWDWNENRPFPVLWPLLSFPNVLAY